ncbi:hypothetical protein V8C42DRAFT_326934 [Trichoderma barbatum]
MQGKQVAKLQDGLPFFYFFLSLWFCSCLGLPPCNTYQPLAVQPLLGLNGFKPPAAFAVEIWAARVASNRGCCGQVKLK